MKCTVMDTMIESVDIQKYGHIDKNESVYVKSLAVSIFCVLVVILS